VQCDEKWSFVAKKQKHCDLEDLGDHTQGDCWDYVAYDPQHKLVLEVIVGRRCNRHALELMQAVKRKTKLPSQARARRKAKRRRKVQARRKASALLLATDGYTAYPRAVQLTFGSPPPTGLSYAVVDKQRDEQGQVIAVQTRPVWGSPASIERALRSSAVSTTINTSFLERHNATDRHRNARKGRRTYRFSKDWLVHEAVTYFTYYTYNFCWCVRTLRSKRNRNGRYPHRTPAMAAGLTDHVWMLDEWLNQIILGLDS
jgi:IS1 family transposase